MQDILTPKSDSFQIVPKICDVDFSSRYFNTIKMTSVGVNHGKIPAIAYAFEIEGTKIVFAGDTSAQSDKLVKLAKNADYLIVHHAIPQHAGAYAKKLHITPKRIGEVAQKAKIKHLILSHRMKRTYGSEAESLKLIQEHYSGNIIWAEDRMKIDIKK
jgi:ribonuclease BN (tRNA processing enzyme)